MTVRATGLTEAIRHLEAVQARSRDLTPVLEVMADDTVSVILDAFESSVSPGGVPWAPLLPSTQRNRRVGRGRGPTGQRRANKILVDTDRLRASNNAVGDSRSIKFGTNVSYGMFHQFGTRQIVPRPFLPVEGDPGSLMLGTTGASGAHWLRVRDSVRHYILTGEVR